ncbi:MAG TPA: thioesterase family protein [Blastocatellia bacterium]|nr:thioesterase family protein [Blastocatellia bacterium]
MPSIELKLRVRWADADAAGRINTPRYFEYFEDGEIELLRQLGQPLRRGDYDFPRVHTECTFKKILALDQPFTMRVSVGRLGRTSIRYDYQFFTEDNFTEPAATGSMTVVVVRDGRPVEIPAELRAALSD